ncbi:hypothetical protein Ae201684P_011185 [Aphanomyces euteiches]|nr:hypothetical protein Ae201684P_011185 [Aphanomyces euteiches]
MAMIPCLYTKHKTQKKKTYHDGHVVRSAAKVLLHDDTGKVIDSMPQTAQEWDRDYPNFEFPKHLVDIDEDATVVKSVPDAKKAAEVDSTSGSSFSRATKAPPGKYVPPRNKFQPPFKRKREGEDAQEPENKNADAFTRTFALNKTTAPKPVAAPTLIPRTNQRTSPPNVQTERQNATIPPHKRAVISSGNIHRQQSNEVAEVDELENYVGSKWPEMPKRPPRTRSESSFRLCLNDVQTKRH